MVAYLSGVLGGLAVVKLQGMVPMLVVADLEETIRFYRETLGLEMADEFLHEGRRVWASLRAGEAELMVTEGDSAGGVAHHDTILYFYPDDVAALHESLRRRGFPVSDLGTTIYGMREFRLEDPNGYQVWCGQSVPPA